MAIAVVVAAGGMPGAVVVVVAIVGVPHAVVVVIARRSVAVHGRTAGDVADHSAADRAHHRASAARSGTGDSAAEQRPKARADERASYAIVMLLFAAPRLGRGEARDYQRSYTRDQKQLTHHSDPSPTVRLLEVEPSRAWFKPQLAATNASGVGWMLCSRSRQRIDGTIRCADQQRLSGDPTG